MPTADNIAPRAGVQRAWRWLANECSSGFVRVWEPPKRLVVSRHLGPDWQFRPDPAQASEVEIQFHSEAPSVTRVELEHRAIERHGEGYEKIRAGVDSPEGWTFVLEAYVAATKK